MKILNIQESGAWDITSYQVLHLSAQLCKLGHEAEVLCPQNSRLFEECKKLKVKALPLTLGAKFGFLETAGRDVVHFYSPLSLSSRVLKKARAGSRVFVSQFRLEPREIFEKLLAVQPYVNMFIGGCNSVQEEFIGAGIEAPRTFLLPPAINIGRWESAMLIKPAMFQKLPYKVGTVSMDPSMKEQELFLMMAKEVLDVMPDTNFMLVGTNDERIRNFARSLGISHKVDILWNRNDVPEIMAMMHIYVKTARRPGFSMSLIEAQASGVTCVIPRLRGLSDFTVNERNGIIVEPDDALSCARAVIRLIGNPQVCHSMSRMAFDYVNNNMSLPVVTNILLGLYEDALAS